MSIRQKFRNWLSAYLGELLRLTRILSEVRELHLDAAQCRNKIRNFEDFLHRIRQSSFAGADVDGNCTEVIIVHHCTVTNKWKIVADNSLRSESYMRLVKDLRIMLAKHGVRYVAVNVPDKGLPMDIKCRMELGEVHIPEKP